MGHDINQDLNEDRLDHNQAQQVKDDSFIIKFLFKFILILTIIHLFLLSIASFSMLTFLYF